MIEHSVFAQRHFETPAKQIMFDTRAMAAAQLVALAAPFDPQA
ncbi:MULTISPECIES: hypothetical protein [unclassified Rhizobium]|nr:MULTISPECIES: hypothetical protein [unclassified Rhizobium]MBP2459417.1 hypothetical protein [Rhizobium sp. PvP014]MBP2531712.1 hypothetical protein [Rhizobium sp. PvP099]